MTDRDGGLDSLRRVDAVLAATVAALDKRRDAVEDESVVQGIIRHNIQRFFAIEQASTDPISDVLQLLATQIDEMERGWRAIAGDFGRSGGWQFWTGLAVSVPVGVFAAFVADWLGWA